MIYVFVKKNTRGNPAEEIGVKAVLNQNTGLKKVLSLQSC